MGNQQNKNMQASFASNKLIWRQNPTTIAFVIHQITFPKQPRFKYNTLSFDYQQDQFYGLRKRQLNGKITRKKSAVQIAADRLSKHIDEMERKQMRMKNRNRTIFDAKTTNSIPQKTLPSMNNQKLEFSQFSSCLSSSFSKQKLTKVQKVSFSFGSEVGKSLNKSQTDNKLLIKSRTIKQSQSHASFKNLKGSKQRWSFETSKLNNLNERQNL